MSATVFNFVPIGVGLYVDDDQPDAIYMCIGEIIADKEVTDCQEVRAALYGAMAQFCAAQSVDLILISEDGVPCMREVYNAFTD